MRWGGSGHDIPKTYEQVSSRRGISRAIRRIDGRSSQTGRSPAISPWHVDWSQTTCSLRRAFGSKEKPSVLSIERYGPTNSFHFSIISDEFKSYQQG